MLGVALASILAQFDLPAAPKPHFVPPSGWRLADDSSIGPEWDKDGSASSESIAINIFAGSSQTSKANALASIARAQKSGFTVLSLRPIRLCGLNAYESRMTHKIDGVLWSIVTEYLVVPSGTYHAVYSRPSSKSEDPAAIKALATLCVDRHDVSHDDRSDEI